MPVRENLQLQCPGHQQVPCALEKTGRWQTAEHRSCSLLRTTSGAKNWGEPSRSLVAPVGPAGTGEPGRWDAPVGTRGLLRARAEAEDSEALLHLLQEGQMQRAGELQGEAVGSTDTTPRPIGKHPNPVLRHSRARNPRPGQPQCMQADP
jgi:hypothetical protein